LPVSVFDFAENFIPMLNTIKNNNPGIVFMQTGVVL